MKIYILIYFLVHFFISSIFAQIEDHNSLFKKSKQNIQFNIQAQTLPVELIYFYSVVQSNGILLKWGTATEVNNFGFEIERAYSSPNSWETIDFVLGSGTSNVPIDYELLDSAVNMSGLVFYRLKQIDIVGTYEYSDTVVVDFLTSIIQENNNVPSQFCVSNNYPNPFNPSTKFNFDIPSQQDLTIKLYDLNGKLVKQIASQEFLPGSYQLYIDFSNYSSGIYFVKFESQNNVLTKSISFVK